jgi:hypothetical protein
MRQPSRHLCAALLLACLSTATAFAQSTQLVPWSETRPIEWADFQGTPPPDAASLNEAAAIHMTIKWHAQFSIQPEALGSHAWLAAVDRVVVSNQVNPRFSWALPSQTTPDVLRHEQFHFNLNEIYRRKLQEELHTLSTRGRSADETMDSLDAQIQAHAQAILDRLSEMQSRYDDETKHGIDAEAQSRWMSTIDAWLADPGLAP